jgi:hypothetical protein
MQKYGTTRRDYYGKINNSLLLVWHSSVDILFHVAMQYLLYGITKASITLAFHLYSLSTSAFNFQDNSKQANNSTLSTHKIGQFGGITRYRHYYYRRR